MEIEDVRQPFGEWGLVELFGHSQLAGYLTEETIAGQEFLRVEVPATAHLPAFYQRYNPRDIYSIIPLTEDEARQVAVNLAARRVPDRVRWMLEGPEEPFEGA